MAQTREENVVETSYKDDLWEGFNIETEIFETPDRDVDFDQINEDKQTYSRFGT